MSLRDRQVGGIPLTRVEATILTLILGACIPIIGYNFWFPLFGVPEELKFWISLVGVLVYLSQCTGRVPAGVECAQLFFGTYTGESFPAGIYLLPRVPFPIISLLLTLIKDDVSKYLGWILEGDVSVRSIVISFFAEGITADGIRVKLEGKLVFEISNAAIFLSQDGNSSHFSSIEEALQAETSNRIKMTIIKNSTAKNLYQGIYDNGATLNDWITYECKFVEDFGVRLARSPVTTVDILSERIQNAFDADNSKSLLRSVSNETAEAYADFITKLPPGTSEEVALAFFNTARMNQGLPPVSINVVKLK